MSTRIGSGMNSTILFTAGKGIKFKSRKKSWGLLDKQFLPPGDRKRKTLKTNQRHHSYYRLFFFNDTATTEIYTLSLHDALPISSIPKRYALFFGRPYLIKNRHVNPNRLGDELYNFIHGGNGIQLNEQEDVWGLIRQAVPPTG